jgi:hypothetical protein
MTCVGRLVDFFELPLRAADKSVAPLVASGARRELMFFASGEPRARRPFAHRPVPNHDHLMLVPTARSRRSRARRAAPGRPRFASVPDRPGKRAWVDLARSPSRRPMAGLCAKRPPTDWVLTLEAAGVEFTNGDEPGVKLRKGS